MKTVRYTCCSSTSATGLLLSYLLLTATVCGGLSVASADDASTQPPGLSTDDAITKREQELKRKEEELLRSIGLPSSQSNSASSVAPFEESGDATIKIDSSDSDEHLRSLKALGFHPALLNERPRRSTTSIPTPDGRIRTYRHPTSARDDTSEYLNTFRRTQGLREERARQEYSNSKSVNVSLQDIERYRTPRLLPLSNSEVATVNDSKARLRIGPTTNSMTLSTLSKFAEVTVDYRSGTWYRVTTSSGLRGWVTGKVLLFNAGVSESSTVRIGALTLARAP